MSDRKKYADLSSGRNSWAAKREQYAKDPSGMKPPLKSKSPPAPVGGSMGRIGKAIQFITGYPQKDLTDVQHHGMRSIVHDMIERTVDNVFGNK